MLKELWEKIKKLNRQPRTVEYIKDANGKEIKYPIHPSKGYSPSKHGASKRGFKHLKNYKPEGQKRSAPSNHMRVVAARAKRQGISVKEYLQRYQNGGNNGPTNHSQN